MEDLVIGQNTSVPYRIYITHLDKQLVLEDINKIEVMFGKIRKVYTVQEADSGISYNPKDGCWYVTLTEEETLTFRDTVPVQIRVQFTDGSIQLSCIQYIGVQRALSKVPIDTVEPEADDEDLDHNCLPLTPAPTVNCGTSVYNYMVKRK